MIHALKDSNWNPQSIAAQMPPREDQNSLARDILETIEDALNNRDTGGGELDMIANIVQRIGDMAGFSGLSSFAQHAVLLNAERQGNSSGVGGLIENFWAKRDKETNDEERKDAAENRIQNFWQDVGEAIEARQNAINQNDYSKTYSNDQLDAMEWKGDENEVWNIGGVNISRKDAFGAGKKARDNWANSNDAKAMSPEDRAKVDQQFSQYLQAIKNNDPAKAKVAYDALPQSAKDHIDAQNSQKVLTGLNA
ncbi:MAG: hypothetical protein CFE32_13190, partial [Alphaproteobacteria bacterium PA3]